MGAARAAGGDNQAGRRNARRTCRWRAGSRGGKGVVLVATVAVMAAGAPRWGFGHPDLEEQVAELTSAIGGEPGNAELLLRRGVAHRRLRRFEEALADFDAAGRARPGWAAPALGRAETLYDAGRNVEALAAAGEFLKVRPGSAEGLVLQGRCYARLGQGAEALGNYERAIAAAGEVTADLFVERARLQAALGRLEEAVKGLDEGWKRLGGGPGLELAAIEYERQRGAFDGALERVARGADRARVKEPWLALRGEVLEQAGRLGEAQGAFEAALRGIESYSPGRRGAAANRHLEKRVREGIARTKGKLVALKR